METETCQRAARILCGNRLDQGLLEGLPRDCRAVDEPAAYAIQTELHRLLCAAGWGPVVGHKIGCTTAVMQRYLDIDHPCAGGILQSGLRRARGEFDSLRQGRLGVECEVAVTLAEDLPATGAPYDRKTVSRAVGTVHAAIEVVADRYRDYAALDVGTLIADDFFNAGCVLGDPVSDWRALDLAAVRGRMWVNDESVGTGSGVDILGHPLQALVWIANCYAELGRELQAGEFVMLGSMVQTHWCEAGDEVRVEIQGLGEASAHFL